MSEDEMPYPAPAASILPSAPREILEAHRVTDLESFAQAAGLGPLEKAALASWARTHFPNVRNVTAAQWHEWLWTVLTLEV